MFIGRKEYWKIWRRFGESGHLQSLLVAGVGELAKSVEADCYFDAVIPVRRLLGL